MNDLEDSAKSTLQFIEAFREGSRELLEPILSPSFTIDQAVVRVDGHPGGHLGSLVASARAVQPMIADSTLVDGEN